MKKLNKKGFTLIELLAVIAILAILLLLVTPNVLNMFKQGKEEAFATQVQSIYKAAEQQLIADSMPSASSHTCYAKGIDEISGLKCGELDISGASDNLQYYVAFTSGKISKIAVADGSYAYMSSANPAINEVTELSSNKHNYIETSSKITYASSKFTVDSKESTVGQGN